MDMLFDTGTFRGVLMLLAGGLAPALVAYVLERLNWFQQLSADKRLWVAMAAAVLLTGLSKLGLDFIPEAIMQQLDWYWLLLLPVLKFGYMQIAHGLDKVLLGGYDGKKP